MQVLKLFVSSPGDVMVERRRVENVVSRLNGEFAGVARLEAVRWETEFYQAYSTFQTQIPRSTDCDLVIGILRWRLGTELPPDFSEKLPDDRPFPSGTAYEILSAIEQRQKGSSVPDIYVFRFAGGSPTPPLDDPNRVNIEREWQGLRTFFEEWFLTARGHFKAAFNQYNSEDDFEQQLERLLRKWVADKVAGGRVVRWPIETKGSPFCGLSAFGTKHAPVFFGRGDEIARAVDLWREAGGRGAPYLLLVGASGSGKSSLARAGLLPRLTTPGVIKDVDVWRIAVMRPGDSPAGPFAALATALLQDEASLPKDDEGRGAALPEIAQGDSRTPAELASVLQHADAAAAVKPLDNALSRVGSAEREREKYGRDVRCDLVLLIDQFEELFDASVGDAERACFIALIAALVATGRIWVVVTLRADFYARMLDQPELKKLKELGATFDLAPPGPAELSAIVRDPAEASGLTFETDAGSGDRLDTRLLREADRPDMLPLVQLALSRLFEGREVVDGQTVLPLKVYESLGGLKGIVNEAGEAALASLGETEKERLPWLLRQLAVPAAEQDGLGQGALTIRAVPASQVAPDGDEAARKLVATLTGARLLTTSGTAADAQVRLTHQRVLEDWSRARTIVAESGDFYRIRAEVEDSRRKWEAGNRRRELLLPRGLPLAEAASIVGKYGNELTPEALTYVRTSRRRAQRAQIIGWGLAAFFFVLAIAATGTGILAYREQQAAVRAQQQAEAALAAATETANGLIVDLAARFKDTVGIPATLIKDILDRARALQQQLIKSGQVSPGLMRSEALALTDTVDILLAIGDTKGALAAAEQALQITAQLVDANPNSTDYNIGLSVSYEDVGDVQVRQGDLAGALNSYHAEYAIFERFARSDPGNRVWQVGLAEVADRLGDVQVPQGDLAGALKSYQMALTITQRLAESDPSNSGWQRSLSVLNDQLGNVQVAEGDVSGALKSYQMGLAIAQRLAESDPSNSGWQRDLGISNSHVGLAQEKQGDLAGALQSYQTELAITQRLAESDPSNSGWQRDLATSNDKLGDVQVAQGDVSGALKSYQTELAITQRLSESDPSNSGWQRDLAQSHESIGDLQRAKGDLPGGLKSYQAARAIIERLAQSDPSNGSWQSDLSALYDRVGTVQMAQGNLVGALQSYQKSLAISQRQAQSDPSNSGWQFDLASSYDLVGSVLLAQSDLAGALRSYQTSLVIRGRLAKSDPSNRGWQSALSVSYERVGDVQEAQGSGADALISYQTSLAVREQLAKSDSSNSGWQHDLGAAYDKIGRAREAQGELAEALVSYQADLVIMQGLARSDPSNSGWQRDLGEAYDEIGRAQEAQGDLAGALVSYQADLVIMQGLARSDPTNSGWQRDLSVAYEGVADVQVKRGQLADALTSYQASLAIAQRLAQSDPGNAEGQRNLSLMYDKISDVQVKRGQFADALTSYQASLAIAQQLAQSDPRNTGWQRDLSVSYDRIGNVQKAQGKLADALTSYQSSLAIRERLAQSNPGNTGWQRDLSIAYEEVGDAQMRQGDLKRALAAYRDSLDIVRELAARNVSDKHGQEDLNFVIGRIGSVAYHFLFAHDFTDALQVSDEAISLAPDKIWIYSNRAHALMFLGHTKEARALYLKYRSQNNVQPGKSWAVLILADFAELRQAGLNNPLMDEIEKDFASAG